MKVYLKYGFIFDPTEGWGHLDQFNDDLFAYFLAHGFEAEIVESADPKKTDKVMVFLKKIEDIQPLAGSPQSPAYLTPKQPVGSKRDLKGKFLKNG